jgi:purine-binding chemotaxis protein CheW
VPRTDHHVLGILSVRGRITTVLDLRRKLRVAEAPHDKHTRVLLVDKGDEIMGLLVDRVLQVYRLSPAEIEPSAVVAGDMSEFVFGVGRPHAQRGRGDGVDDADLLILLEPAPLLRK